MKISALAREMRARGFDCELRGDEDRELTGATCDSRRVRQGDLFLALPGTRTDGGCFIVDAVRGGAAAIACARGADPGRTTALVLDDIAQAAGHIAAILYGDPARSLTLVGVTGTNGKTSCTYILESIWHAGGQACGVIGTVSVRWPGCEEKAAMTTPSAPDLQRMLAAMAADGCVAAALEVSSHALSQYRVAGCSFRAAIFTNLTRDHLDYHGDEESYFTAKAALFVDHLGADGIAILNADDPYAMRLTAVLAPQRVRTFSSQGLGTAWAVPIDVADGLAGLRGRIRVGEDEIAIETPLIGRPNLGNLLAAAAAARVLGIDARQIQAGLCACRPVPGRLERVGQTNPVVLVDYAHTPDALERTLETARALTSGRLIVVFGCGGDRDKGKRPMMGEVAARRADVCVLTSDNPRSEDPRAILSDIERGLMGVLPARTIGQLACAGARGYVIEAERESAIDAALQLASERDVVLVAGKGHEDYQEVGGVRRPFDDREVVRRLQLRSAAACS